MVNTNKKSQHTIWINSDFVQVFPMELSYPPLFQCHEKLAYFGQLQCLFWQTIEFPMNSNVVAREVGQLVHLCVSQVQNC